MSLFQSLQPHLVVFVSPLDTVTEASEVHAVHAAFVRHLLW